MDHDWHILAHLLPCLPLILHHFHLLRCSFTTRLLHHQTTLPYPTRIVSGHRPLPQSNQDGRDRNDHKEDALLQIPKNIPHVMTKVTGLWAEQRRCCWENHLRKDGMFSNPLKVGSNILRSTVGSAFMLTNVTRC